MEIRYMRREDWWRIVKREYVSRSFQKDGNRICESLLLMKEVSEPLDVKSGSEMVTVVNKDYSWLQIAAEGGHVWLTAMFDADGRFLQAYFDITAGNNFDDIKNPCFRDMYLDVVLTPSGEIVVLDEDELDEALNVGDITIQEYDEAKKACSGLCERLSVNWAETLKYCEKARKLLKDSI